MTDSLVQELADSQRLLVEIRKRPMRYQELRAMLGSDADRALVALDRLLARSLIRRRIIKGSSHFEAVPDHG